MPRSPAKSLTSTAASPPDTSLDPPRDAEELRSASGAQMTIGDPSPLPAEPDCTVTGHVFAPARCGRRSRSHRGYSRSLMGRPSRSSQVSQSAGGDTVAP